MVVNRLQCVQRHRRHPVALVEKSHSKLLPLPEPVEELLDLPQREGSGGDALATTFALAAMDLGAVPPQVKISSPVVPVLDAPEPRRHIPVSQGLVRAEVRGEGVERVETFASRHMHSRDSRHGTKTPF